MYKRAGVWWACIRHEGKKIQKSLETKDRRLAKAIEAKVKTEIVEGSYFEKLVGRDKTFKDMMDKLMAEHAPKVSNSMQIGYGIKLRNHLNPFFGEDAKLLSISPKLISQYKVYRSNKGAKPATINRELSMLSKAFSLASKEWEWIRDNPVSKVPREKENNQRDRWLSVDEERLLLDNCPEWLREIMLFALHTGLRQEELLSLKWSRVNEVTKTILITDTKNGNPVTLPLNKIALGVIERKARVRSIDNDFVFRNRNGKKVNAHNLRTSFYIVLRKVGIKDFRWHDLRHTFATRMAQAGFDLYKISKLLNHKDIKMTQRYSHHCPDSLRDGVEMLAVDYNLTTVEEKRVENVS
ncbi:MAG: site-specific integrase [Candidatus Marinimicrobia bacterium]|jgi:integrase|nr:site-specific integrase [Candidatus Neomarinimicrobiota bacterium]